MTPAAVALLAWLWSQPSTLPRAVNTAIAIAEASVETWCPQYYASLLDVFAFGETNYSDDPNISGGCDGVRIGTPCANGRYVSPWMLQRALVPRGATLLDEARIAIATFRESARECPTWPLSIYAGFGCKQSALVDGRVNVVVRMLAGPGGGL